MFAAASSKGQAMSLDQAVALALRTDEGWSGACAASVDRAVPWRCDPNDRHRCRTRERSRRYPIACRRLAGLQGFLLCRNGL